jgi:hypothetical protein
MYTGNVATGRMAGYMAPSFMNNAPNIGMYGFPNSGMYSNGY